MNTEQQSVPALRLLAVVVVYRLQPMQSSSVQTLLAAAASLPKEIELSIVVADNTPGGQHVEPLPAMLHYRAYPENPGLARPYNDALAQAERDGVAWLLTLDQDTALPHSFLVDMANVARQHADNDTVAAVVPRILDKGKLVSPFQFKGGWLPWVVPVGVSGLAGPHLSALNSASLLRVRALRKIGGYDERYPLHNSDTRLYQKLDAAGMRVAIAGDVVVPHELSILDREGRMSPERYRKMLVDERLFWKEHMGRLARLERMVRLALRYIKGTLRGENATYRRITYDELRQRL